jgi:hypothetical protein
MARVHEQLAIKADARHTKLRRRMYTVLEEQGNVIRDSLPLIRHPRFQTTNTRYSYSLLLLWLRKLLTDFRSYAVRLPERCTRANTADLICCPQDLS